MPIKLRKGNDGNDDDGENEFYVFEKIGIPNKPEVRLLIFYNYIL
jgi:hypothetical protein